MIVSILLLVIEILADIIHLIMSVNLTGQLILKEVLINIKAPNQALFLFLYNARRLFFTLNP